jgi:hypothetical protein
MMRVKYKVFQSGTSSWESLFDEAAAFASEIGRDRLIGISHSEGRHDWVANGVVTVWYWGGESDES